MPRRPHTSDQALSAFRILVQIMPEWMHGYALIERTGVKSGTLYPLLMRLADDGLLEAKWEDAPTRGRPPRHLYRLTKAGLVLAESRLEERDFAARDKAAPA